MSCTFYCCIHLKVGNTYIVIIIIIINHYHHLVHTEVKSFKNVKPPMKAKTKTST